MHCSDQILTNLSVADGFSVKVGDNVITRKDTFTYCSFHPGGKYFKSTKEQDSCTGFPHCSVKILCRSPHIHCMHSLKSLMLLRFHELYQFCNMISVCLPSNNDSEWHLLWKDFNIDLPLRSPDNNGITISALTGMDSSHEGRNPTQLNGTFLTEELRVGLYLQAICLMHALPHGLFAIGYCLGLKDKHNLSELFNAKQGHWSAG